MSKNIKVTDEIYARLEEQAKRGYRPITSHLEFLLDYFEAGEKNKTENPEKIVSPSAKNQRPNGEHRMVATGDRRQPVRESLPDDLEEALYHYKQISEDLKLESLRAWCNKMAVDEAWTDEQACIEINKRKQKLLAEREEVAAILKENGVNLGLA